MRQSLTEQRMQTAAWHLARELRVSSSDDADGGGVDDYCVTVRHGCHTWHRAQCQVCACHITVMIIT